MQAGLKLEVIDLARFFNPISNDDTDTTDLIVQNSRPLLDWFDRSAGKGGAWVGQDEMYEILVMCLGHGNPKNPLALTEYADRVLEWIAGITQKSVNTPLGYEVLRSILELAMEQPNSDRFELVLKRANKLLSILDYGPRTR